MTKVSSASSRWLAFVLINSLLIQGGIYVVRPIVTYKALELGADAALVGIIGATFALAPLIFAIRIGQFVDKGRAENLLEKWVDQLHRLARALAFTLLYVVAAKQELP